jgi:hypothetical protein
MYKLSKTSKTSIYFFLLASSLDYNIDINIRELYKLAIALTKRIF